MAASQVSSFTLDVTIDPPAAPGSSVINNVTVASSNGSSNAAGTASLVVTSPNVTASKSIAGGNVHPEGAVITYTIVLSNSGSLEQPDNPGSELMDLLPSSLTLLSAASTSGTAVANVGTNTVTWNGSIAGGGSVTITIQASVHAGTAGTTISNSASVFFDSDFNGSNEAQRQSDDPATAAASDPTSFVVTGSVPALSTMMLALMAALLAAMALHVMKT
jgi:uncharacterized repeat protein (TIGR01451 family)